MQRSHLLFIATLLVILIGIYAFYQSAAFATRGGEDAPLYSSQRHDPYGTAAIDDLLGERGITTGILNRPSPPAGEGGVLVQVLPAETETLLQLERLKEWVERGNTVIQFTRTATPLMAAAGLGIPKRLENLKEIETAEARGKPQTDVPAVELPATWIARPAARGEIALIKPRSLQMYSPAILEPAAGDAHFWHPLVQQTRTRQWLAAQRRYGQGTIIVVGTPTPILNHTLGEQANLEFVLSLIIPDRARPTQVLFDEWSHGIGHESTIIGFIREVGLLPVLLQLAFVLFLYVWATAKTAAPRRVAPKRQRTSTEQIETLGHLYRKALRPDVAFEKVYQEVRRRIAAALRCPPAEIESTLNHVPAGVADRARAILQKFHAIGRGAGPTCPACGYSLLHNTTGKCPECGAAIPWLLKEKIAEQNAYAGIPEGARRRRSPDAAFAAVLRESHLFLEERSRVRSHR